jgi:hypothetical protein
MSGAPDLPRVESADAFEAWLASAEVGAQVVYAVGREFPRTLSTAILASAWLRRGLIVTVFRRDGAETQFIAEKKASPSALEAGLLRRAGLRGGVAARAADKDDDCVEQRILRLIARHANFDRAAPTYREMARAGGLGGSQAALSAARRACGALIASGAVTRENSRDQSRTRFVLPDGRRTAWLELRNPLPRSGRPKSGEIA